MGSDCFSSISLHTFYFHEIDRNMHLHVTSWHMKISLSCLFLAHNNHPVSSLMFYIHPSYALFS